MRTAPGQRPDIDLTDLWGRIPVMPVEDAGRGPDDVPILIVGGGPRTCTSGQQLVHVCGLDGLSDYDHVYDVNGFYAALGVPPRADRRALTAAYMALDGQGSARLTEIIKILLDPRKRAAYNRMTPGQRFRDRETIETLIRAESLRRLRENDPLSSVFETESVYSEASNRSKSRPEYATPAPRPVVDTPAAWGYAYYLWNVLDSTSARTHLPLWQQMLITALSADGGPGIQFAVGRSVLGSAPTAIWVGEVPVAFLSAGTAPQQNLAEHVATQLRALATTQIAQTYSHANIHPGEPTT